MNATVAFGSQITLKRLTLISFAFLPVLLIAQLDPEQVKQVDSLKQTIQKAEHDSTVVNAMIAWDNIIYVSDPELDLELNQKIDSLSALNLQKELSEKEHRFFLKSRGFALNSLGIIERNMGEFATAKQFLTQGLKLRTAADDLSGIASSYDNLGSLFGYEGDYASAIEYQTKALKLWEELDNGRGVASSLGSIGNIYADQGEFEKAIDYHTRSLNIREEIGDTRGVAYTLGNLSSIYIEQERFQYAMDNLLKVMPMLEEMGDAYGMANTLDNMGIVYIHLEDDAKALEFANKALEIRQSMGDQRGVAFSLQTISRCYMLKQDYNEAIDYSSKSLKLAQEIEALGEVEGAARVLWQAYKKMGRYAEAMSTYELYIQVTDSINSEENRNEVIRQEYKYAYEKQAAADSIQAAEAQKVTDAQLAAQEAQLEQEATQRYALFGGLGLLALFGGFMFNRFRITSKQKDVIEEQKGVVEQQKAEVDEAHEQLTEKNKEILDSIAYAKRIQHAILPPTKLVKEYLSNSFILYKPKDVVAGDFYWMESFASQPLKLASERGEASDSEGNKHEIVYFAAADCTGHGVPGAMVSVICVNGLNRSVREFGLREPGQILDKTRELVIKEFEKSEEEVKDGMDISLCALNTKTRELKWAGANNPLWIVRNGAQEVEETKADKQPIGKYALEKPFTTHTLQLHEGDTIYTFSDGYPDQFGGENGKKYKSGKFKRTLLEMASKPIDQQHDLLDQEFESWKGGIEQIDDVCVIGVKI